MKLNNIFQHFPSFAAQTFANKKWFLNIQFGLNHGHGNGIRWSHWNEWNCWVQVLEFHISKWRKIFATTANFNSSPLLLTWLLFHQFYPLIRVMVNGCHRWPNWETQSLGREMEYFMWQMPISVNQLFLLPSFTPFIFLSPPLLKDKDGDKDLWERRQQIVSQRNEFPRKLHNCWNKLLEQLENIILLFFMSFEHSHSLCSINIFLLFLNTSWRRGLLFKCSSLFIRWIESLHFNGKTCSTCKSWEEKS